MNHLLGQSRLDYQTAKAWSQSQSPLVNGVKGWKELKASGRLPPGMPAWPQGAYGAEFESWGEFLGTGTLAAVRRSFKSYHHAKRWARAHVPKITTKAHWVVMVKAGGCPVDIPTDPRSHYKGHFKGWGDFLGTGTIAPQCRQMATYEEARQWVLAQSPIIHSREDYLKRRRASRRTDLPAAPDRVYKGEFKGWPDFLSVRRIASTSMTERLLKQELASFLPVNPDATTRLMGVSGKALQVDIYLPSWNLVIEYDGSHFHKDRAEQDYAKTDSLQKANPGLRIVRVREAPLETLGCDDVLVARAMEPLRLAQKVVAHLLALGLIKRGYQKASRAYLRRKTPAGHMIVGARWQTYDQAKAWAGSQKLSSRAQWLICVREPGFLPADIPAAPNLVYGGIFQGWSDFLGVKIVAHQNRSFQSYEQAKAWARRRGIITGKQWLALSAAGNLPKTLPSNPNATYKECWRGWGDFLGVSKPKDVQWADFEEVKAWCQSQVPPVDSLKAWQQAKDKASFPKHFPKSVWYHYGKAAVKALKEPQAQG